jgi:CPA2 family monovalent cation:H+ antiporter-2
MATRGEFSLIIAALAVSSAGTTLATDTAQELYAFTVGYVLVMSVLGTTLMQNSQFIESLLIPYFERESSDGPTTSQNP